MKKREMEAGSSTVDGRLQRGRKFLVSHRTSATSYGIRRVNSNNRVENRQQLLRQAQMKLNRKEDRTVRAQTRPDIVWTVADEVN